MRGTIVALLAPLSNCLLRIDLECIQIGRENQWNFGLGA